MKISALKQMVREAVRAEMKAMEKRLAKEFAAQLNEAVNGKPAPAGVETPAPTGLSEIRARFRKSQQLAEGARTYDTLPESSGNLAEKPSNPVGTTKTGERYASGQGVLDWFNNSKDDQAVNEHNKSLEQMNRTDEYVQSVIGRKRI